MDGPQQKQGRRTRTLGLALAIAGLALLPSLTGCAPGGGSSSDARRPETYSFWPLFPAEPRIQFLTSYRFSDDVEPVRSGLEDIIYGEERRVLPINKPYGLDMRDGRIYVCDTRNRGVIVLDLRTQETRLMGATGMARTQSPTDLAIAADGMIYVSDSARGAIFVFDKDERYVTAMGLENMRPTGIDVFGDEVFVCDFTAQGVHVFDRHTGEHLRTFGSPGDGEGEFVRPLGLGISATGTVYVSDVIQCRVQRFSPRGDYLGDFGEMGDVVGTFVRPKMLAVDGEGIVFVVDAGFANVQMFNSDDDLLMFFGSAGGHPGSMYLPAGVECYDGDLDLFDDYVHPAFEAQRLVLVTNQFGNNKVSVYAIGQLKEGRTVQDIATVRAEQDTGMLGEGESPRDQLLPEIPSVEEETGTEEGSEEPTPPTSDEGENSN